MSKDASNLAIRQNQYGHTLHSLIYLNFSQFVTWEV